MKIKTEARNYSLSFKLLYYFNLKMSKFVRWEANHLVRFQFPCILMYEYPELSSLTIILVLHFALYNRYNLKPSTDERSNSWLAEVGGEI